MSPLLMLLLVAFGCLFIAACIEVYLTICMVRQSRRNQEMLEALFNEGRTAEYVDLDTKDFL